MKKLGSLLIFAVLTAFLFSCANEDPVLNNDEEIIINDDEKDDADQNDGDEDDNQGDYNNQSVYFYHYDNDQIKHESSSDGTIVQKYFYDEKGKIVELNCRYYCIRYLYDENDRLVKEEASFDFFSSSFGGKTELMTFENSLINRYSLYDYDEAGRFSKIEHFFNETGHEFELRSFQTFEYEGAAIVKVNLHLPEGKICKYDVYTYDDHENVTNYKFYQMSFITEELELTHDYSYKYDNYKNPYRIFSILGRPGLFMNFNNIIEDVVSVEGQEYQKIIHSYEYNEEGYPVKVISEYNVIESHPQLTSLKASNSQTPTFPHRYQFLSAYPPELFPTKSVLTIR